MSEKGYYDFVTTALNIAEPSTLSDRVLYNAFSMIGEKDFDEIVEESLKSWKDPDVFCECFHKQFRQIDVTVSGHLDMIIWFAMREEGSIFKILRYMSENRHVEKMTESYLT